MKLYGIIFKAMKKILLLTFILFFGLTAFSQKVFDFNNNCQLAYQEIMKLKLDSGQRLLNKEKQINPNNLIPYFLENYIDFFVLFFNEDKVELKKRKKNFSARLDLLEEGPSSSPFKNYSRAVILLQKALIEIKFGERWNAVWDFKKGYSTIKENNKSFASFGPNNLVFGPLKVVVGTIPAGYKWAANLLGMKGSIKEGMQMMRNFLNSQDVYSKLFFNEAAFYYCYLSFYIENNKPEVFQFINRNNLDVVNNHLFTFLAGNLNINNNKVEIAKNIIQNRNKSDDYLQTPIWDFEMGLIKLYHLETEEAARYLENFVSKFKGRFYIKDAYQKLSWCYYLLGNYTKAEQNRQLVMSKGSTDSDADKKALKDAKSGKWPNTLLLKARLLNDGGYNKEALSILYGKSNTDFNDDGDALEFTYRVARIYDDLERDDEAIQTYLNAIILGKNRSEYYAARAALQIAQIYEKRGLKAKAIEYFEICIRMKDHEYEDSLEQRAKSGIARCNGE
jgi:tetratricopeptide (TPR) repeat protein